MQQQHQYKANIEALKKKKKRRIRARDICNVQCAAMHALSDVNGFFKYGQETRITLGLKIHSGKL